MKKYVFILVGMLFAAGCGDSGNTQGGSASSSSENQSEQMMAAVSSKPSPQLVAGVEALNKGNIREAVKGFEQAIRQNPKDTEAYILLGQTYMHLKEYNRAIETFMIASKVSPDNGQIHYLLATNFGLAGNVKMAEVEAQKSLVIFRQQKDETNFKRAVALIRGLPASQTEKTSQE